MSGFLKGAWHAVPGRRVFAVRMLAACIALVVVPDGSLAAAARLFCGPEG